MGLCDDAPQGRAAKPFKHSLCTEPPLPKATCHRQDRNEQGVTCRGCAQEALLLNIQKAYSYSNWPASLLVYQLYSNLARGRIELRVQTCLLSTEKATLSTSLLCPMKRLVVFPEFRSHSRSVPSHDPVQLHCCEHYCPLLTVESLLCVRKLSAALPGRSSDC